MGMIRELSERLWQGEETVRGLGPMSTGGLEEVAPGVAFVLSFANVSAFETDDGLVLVDTGSLMLFRDVHRALRGWSQSPLHTAVYTHGHVDHCFGVQAFDEEHQASPDNVPRPRVIAHEALVERFERYVLTAGYNGIINARQFGLPVPFWPLDYRQPDLTYRSELSTRIGGVRFELHHDRGETDDATWVWLPDHKVLCTGDLFVWVSPNCGNPQKVQRYPREWAQALRQMQNLGAELLLPGHGPPIFGAERIEHALSSTARYLESIVEQTLEHMNAGLSLESVIERVDPPDDLFDTPWLQPTYDEPEFIVRNLWRLYGGWYDGNPAHLKPAPTAELGRELADLAGGSEQIARRAQSLAEAGRMRVACDLVELACRADPTNKTVAAIRAAIYRERAAREPSLMAANIYTDAARNPPR